MEDEDVDSVGDKFSAPISESNNIDSLLSINSVAKNASSPKNDIGSPSAEGNQTADEEKTPSVNKLKSVLVNHDAVDIDRFKKNEDSCTDLPSPSPKKVNGEVDKSESCGSSGESCDDYDKNEVLNVSEDSKRKFEKESDASDSKDSNKRKRLSSDRSDVSNGSENESDDESSNSSPVEFRGFKRRKIFEMEAEKTLNDHETNRQIEVVNSDTIAGTEKPKSVELRRSARNASIAKRHNSEAIISVETKEESGDQLTEYAQYLGLQPTVKFKCGRCGEKHFQSMASLNAHQMICCKTSSNALTKQIKPQSDSNLSTNFRITRKVYLCSACGTYYENWKLFLHMRDMHKRHICLFCLGMFSVAERLAEHLLYQHNVHEKTCKSPEEFLNLFKGSCYLTCCSCEKMFTERDDFYDHQCKDAVASNPSNWNNDPVSLTPKDIKELAQKCNLCGVKCGHFRTCPKVAHKFQQNSQSSSFTNSPSTPNSNSPNLSLEKYYVPVPANVQKNWTPNNLNQEILKQALSLSHSEKEYYDVSSAASFCHVDIANDSDNQSSPEKAVLGKSNIDRKKCPKLDNRKSPPRCQDVEGPAVNKDEGEQQGDCSKLLPNNSNNPIVDSVSEESDNSDDRVNSNVCKQQDEEETKKCSDDEKCSSKELSDDGGGGDGDDNDDDKMSTEEEANIQENWEKVNDDKVDENGIDDIPDKLDKIPVVEDIESKSKKLENEISSCSVRLDRLSEDLISKVEEKETEGGEGDTEEEEEEEIEEEEIEGEEENDDEEEEISQHDSASNSNSSSANSRSSSRNSTDHDHNDDSQDNISNKGTGAECGKTEDDKKENSTENVSIEEDHVEDDSSSNNEEKLSQSSNEEMNDDRLESNKDMVDRSDENESEDSDKLSVVLCEDELAEKTNDEDSNSCKGTPSDEPVKGDNLSEHMETDVISEHGGDGNDSSTLQEGDTENDVAMEESQDTLPPKENYFQYDGMSIQLASEEVLAMALTLEDKMDSLSSQSVVKECVRTSCTTCSYCSHAVKIGVNGKQLAIHLLTEHRYMPVKNETVDDIIERLKKSLDELQDIWFNTDSYDSSDKDCFVPYDHTYECFQCNYSANTHKDLFSHKRKVHQKTILYCSMCKENFYSYSELLCHMCPGLYDAAKDIQFRCCLCPLDRIPSAFRLMVHLRKTHHTCDICLEIVDDQQKLSAHMVKHKLHHLCYRCGIAYRNKPDITKHLFWKHGTESVLCKKCLQKKWPHVYHFCIPPSSFICEECNLSFSKAVYLKVHKRFHNSNLPYSCNSCEQKFVSKKLLIKHERTHEVVTAEDSVSNDKTRYKSSDSEKRIEQNDLLTSETPANLPEESACTVPPTETPEKADESSVKPHKKKSKKDKERKIKPVVDVYDLPPLNLSSESDDTEDEKETRPAKTSGEDKDESSKPDDIKTLVISNDEMQVESEQLGVEPETKTTESIAVESNVENEESAQPVTVVDGIWDNFHTYKAELEKRENLDIANKQSILSQLDPSLPMVVPKDTVLGDHDYCLPNNVEEKSDQADETDPSSKLKSNEHSSSIDHDYCTQKNNLDNSDINSATNLLNLSNQSENTETPPKRKQKSPKKKMMKQHNSSSSSDSSSESDSSSCSCGTNCSCTSSSSNSSSSSSSDSDSSSSDGRNNNSSVSTNKREKKKERLKSKRKEVVKMTEPQPPAEQTTITVPVEPEEPSIKESDLETDETATDEEFYDQYPQMQANQILAEKRNQLMLLATVAPTVNNGTASPPVPNPNNSSSTNINLDPISSPKLEIVAPPVTSVMQPQTQSKKKVKTKKRRKSSSLSTANKNRSASKQHNSAYDTPQPSTSFSSLMWQSSAHGKKVANDISPMYMQSSIQPTTPSTTSIKTLDHMSLLSPVTSQHQQFHHSREGSESNSSKRSSKRRRVRNKFYGYSSDEEGEHQQTPPIKWKKFTPIDSNVKNVHNQQPQQLYSQPFQQPVAAAHSEYNHSYQQQLSPVSMPQKITQPTVRTTFEENQINNSLVMKRTMPTPISSGSSSDSDADSDSDTSRLEINQQINPTSITAAGLNTGTSEKDDKLYCYCQCPYDEVSEMIACDGLDCAIEWFHFECVGIMVPPKGKWYCPDCRKRRGLS